MKINNVAILNHTLEILEKGFYFTESGKKVSLQLTPQQMKECTVYFPEKIHKLGKDPKASHVYFLGDVYVGCENADSFSVARVQATDTSVCMSDDYEKRVLVLNFANPVHPGGGVRRGARAQEEGLCRMSSLLHSLEGRRARKYYDYNKALHSYLGSDAMIYTPNVEIIKDEKGNLLDETTIVSVLTCAAPMLCHGMDGMTQDEYEHLMSKRITGILNVAASLGYKKLVLGAFGCGAFGNDARIVSDLFYRALKEFDYDGMAAKDMFRCIDFAVLDHTKDQYNFKEFSRNFSDFYREEKSEVEKEVMEARKILGKDIDKIRGSLAGGAIGDALGYAVEFLDEDEIVSKYGSDGITSYELEGGKALISDDTQMILFTATGILVGETRNEMRGLASAPRIFVKPAYRNWYLTQTKSFEEVKDKWDPDEERISWLLDLPELFERRAPGLTCLEALRNYDEDRVDFVSNPVNQSKGCGGIMRVAPIALYFLPTSKHEADLSYLDMEAAQIAAITHGHSLGYMPAAVLTHIITRILIVGQARPLKEIVEEARDAVAKLFAGDKHLEELVDIINFAITLSENKASDVDNIHRIGEGWVAEETLAIAIYCSLKYSTDFSAAVIAAVNHKGDSDSTGAVTGNIVGALVGWEKIEEKWKKDLELRDVILEIADDLCYGCMMSEYSRYTDPAWVAKYMNKHRYMKE